MAEIDKKPQQKRKLLEKILNEHRHMMTQIKYLVLLKYYLLTTIR